MIRAALAAGVLLADPAAGATPGPAEYFGQRRGAFLANGMGARPVALGEAYTALADDASAISWNPGGLARLTGAGGVAMYDALGEGVSLSYLAAAMPTAAGVAAASVAVLGFGAYDLRDANGDLTGRKSATDVAVAAGWSVRHPAGLGLPGSTGLAVEVVSESVGGMLVGATLGTVVPLGPRFSLGLAGVHLGAPAEGFALPGAIRAGAAWTPPAIGRIAADFSYQLAGGRVTAGAGAELDLHRQVRLRAGYRWHGAGQAMRGLTGLTAGAGVRFGRIGVDYAYQPFGELVTSHRLGLSWGLTGGAARGGYAAALTAYQLGELDAARAGAEAAVAAEPGHWEAWQLLGACRWAARDGAGAIEAYARSLELNPENPVLREWVARHADGAPPPDAEGEYRAALARYAEKDYAGALERAGEAARLDPRHWQAWQLIGHCLYARGDATGALPYYEASLGLHPNNPELKKFVATLKKKKK